MDANQQAKMREKKQQLIKLLNEDTKEAGIKVTDIAEFDPETFSGIFLAGKQRYKFKMTPEKTTWEPIK